MTDQAAPPARSVEDPRELLAVFRERRERAVTAPRGSLALVTTHYPPGTAGERVWPVPGEWALREGGAPGLLVRTAAANGVRVDGALVDGEAVVRASDDPSPSEIVFSETVTGTAIANEQGYALRVWDSESEGLGAFGRIDGFDYDPAWVLEGTFTPVEGLSVGFEHVKDDGRERETPIPGEITFELDGVPYALAAFKAGRALQLVFGDATNGESTYSVGRFLFVAPNPDGTIILDFNRAVLPPCAFSFAFNCPMPPRQNRFAVPIEAGEKTVLDRDGAPLH